MTRKTTRMIWANKDYTVLISMTEQEEYKEMYPGGPRYWYNIPGTMRFVVETEYTTAEYESAMHAFKFADDIA